MERGGTMKRYIILGIMCSLGFGQMVSEVVALQYISPSELMQELHVQYTFNENNEIILDGRIVHLTINRSINKVLLTGTENGVNSAKELIDFLDVPPRQIVIEAKIVEINNERLSELGMDWQTLIDNTYLYGSPEFRWHEDVQDYGSGEIQTTTKSYGIHMSTQVHMPLGAFLKIIQDKGVGRIVNTPKIVTTNNQEGMILDGSRVTYVTRYSSYADVFETQEMTAGLSLAVTPSLGESGYLKLQINAKVTTLGQVISGSPSETGQIIENTVIVKNGEEFLLGGFNTTQTEKHKRKVPILGTILPFLFSRTKEISVTRDFLIVLKPSVIDLTSVEIPDIE